MSPLEIAIIKDWEQLKEGFRDLARENEALREENTQLRREVYVETSGRIEAPVSVVRRDDAV
jgi:hypothetical protein